MRLILVLTLLVSSICNGQNKPYQTIEVDTILEKNSPTNLDLEKHQLFIDTTANSNYHKVLSNRKTQKYETWTVIRKLADNQFVIYDRSDGMDPIIQLNNKKLIFDGVHEQTTYKIESKKIINDKIEITIRENNRSFKNIEIKKSNSSNVSVIRFYGKKNYEFYYWITKIENITLKASLFFIQFKNQLFLSYEEKQIYRSTNNCNASTV
ncbi:hypothetical protein ACFFGL_00990, partial [Mesonia maritima]